MADAPYLQAPQSVREDWAVVRVGVAKQVPFVEESSAVKWSGFSVMIMDAAALQSKLSVQFREYPTVDTLIEAVAKMRSMRVFQVWW